MTYDKIIVGSDIPSNGLVAYYPFNGNANDAIGTNNGTPLNGAVLSVDRYGNTNSAYYFPNDNSTIRLDSSVLCTGGVPFSVSVWAKPSDFANGYPTIFHLKTNTTYPLRLFIRQNGICGILSYSNWGHCYISKPISINTYYHFTITYDGTPLNNTGTGLTLYINGSSVGCVRNVSSGVPTANLSEIGGASTSANGYFHGYIDEFRIYNRALSPQEISGFINPISSLVGFWNGVNINGSTLYDRSYYKNNGTVSGSIATTQGKLGNSMIFNNSTSNFITLNNTVDMRPAQLTISCLVKFYAVNTGVYQLIIDNMSAQPWYGFALGLLNNKICYEAYHNGDTYYYSNTLIEPNKWYKIDVTDGGGICKMYINNVLDNTLNVTGDIGYTVNQPAMIGKRCINNTYPMYGEINYIQLFNYVKSFREVKKIQTQ